MMVSVVLEWICKSDVGVKKIEVAREAISRHICL
jgi:hypothetical protein